MKKQTSFSEKLEELKTQRPNIQPTQAPKKPISLWDRVGIEMQNITTTAPAIDSPTTVKEFAQNFLSELDELQQYFHKTISYNILDIIAMLRRNTKIINYGYTAKYIIHDLDNPPSNVEIITQKRGLSKEAITSIGSPIYVSFYLCEPETSEQIHQYTVAYCIGADTKLYLFSSDNWAEDFGKYREELGIEL